MPSAVFFRALNFYVRERFLDAGTCARLRETMRQSPNKPARVALDAPTNITVAEDLRRTIRSEVPLELASELVSNLALVRDEASKHFGVPLTETEPLQFLIYRPGDFYVRHSDRDRDGTNRREVSVILFLSSPGDTTFTGGNLKFYGMTVGKQAEFRLTPEEGLLIAFRSDIPHEVETVTSGERFTAVTWFA